jgi:hypothetical protein
MITHPGGSIPTSQISISRTGGRPTSAVTASDLNRSSRYMIPIAFLTVRSPYERRGSVAGAPCAVRRAPCAVRRKVARSLRLAP